MRRFPPPPFPLSDETVVIAKSTDVDRLMMTQPVPQTQPTQPVPQTQPTQPAPQAEPTQPVAPNRTVGNDTGIVSARRKEEKQLPTPAATGVSAPTVCTAGNTFFVELKIGRRRCPGVTRHGLGGNFVTEEIRQLITVTTSISYFTCGERYYD